MIRGPILRIYKTVHTWTGLIGGMALFICFYAGALTMFKEPLDRWATPVDPERQWVSEAQMPEFIHAVLARYPDAAKSFTVHILPQENTPAPITWHKQLTEERGGPSESWWVNVNSAGDLEAQRYEPSAMAELIDQLHQTAGIPGGAGHHAIGLYVMGTISALYLLAIVSGLIVLLPTLVKDFFSLRKGKSSKRFWLDAHNLVGITSLPFHIVIALTVVVFAFHDQIYDGLGKLAYGEQAQSSRQAVPPEASSHKVENLLLPHQLIAKVHDIAPDFVAREITYNNVLTARAGVRIAGEDDAHMLRGFNRGFVSLDPYTGSITDTDYLPGHEDNWMDIVITFFALHLGSYGGDPIRWVYFFLGMSGAFLFYTGNLLWVESRRRRQRLKDAPVVQDRNTRLMAAATVGVCWGSVAGVSAAMVAGKWLQGVGSNPNDWYLWAYYSVFLGSVTWAFARGAGRAAVDLLRLCSLTTLAIPLTGTIAFLFPNLPAWLHTSSDLLLVELTALVAGLLFGLMARRTRARINSSPADSVWAVVDAGARDDKTTGEVASA